MQQCDLRDECIKWALPDIDANGVCVCEKHNEVEECYLRDLMRCGHPALYKQPTDAPCGKCEAELDATMRRLHGQNATLLKACLQARKAIASLDDDALGIASGTGEDGGEITWPIRDELLSKLDDAIAQAEYGGFI